MILSKRGVRALKCSVALLILQWGYGLRESMALNVVASPDVMLAPCSILSAHLVQQRKAPVGFFPAEQPWDCGNFRIQCILCS